MELIKEFQKNDPSDVIRTWMCLSERHESLVYDCLEKFKYVSEDVTVYTEDLSRASLVNLIVCAKQAFACLDYMRSLIRPEVLNRIGDSSETSIRCARDYVDNLYEFAVNGAFVPDAAYVSVDVAPVDSATIFLERHNRAWVPVDGFVDGDIVRGCDACVWTYDLSPESDCSIRHYVFFRTSDIAASVSSIFSLLGIYKTYMSRMKKSEIVG